MKGLALIHMGTELMLLHGNPERFQGSDSYIEGYGGQSVMVKAVKVPLGMGQ